MTILCIRKRIPQNRMTISYPRVGRNRIRPTNDPERGEYVQNRTNVSCTRARITQNRTNPVYIRKWMTQIHGVRFLPKTSVGRIQYAPTRGRKRYAQGGGVRDWGRKRYVQGCGVRFLPKTSVGRIQYAPTRGRKRYAWDCGVRDWGRKWYVRGGIYPIRFIIPPLRYEK